jgi:hypothetical protein
MALGSCGHRITHQLRPINMNGRSILSETSILYFRALSSATASSRADGEPGTSAAVVKDRTGPDLDERSVQFQYITETGNFSDKSIRLSPLAAARPLTIRSWPKALNARGSRRACQMAISRNAVLTLSRPLDSA